MHRQCVCLIVLLLSIGYVAPTYAQQASSETISPASTTNPSPQVAQKLPPTVHGNGIVNFVPLWTDAKVVGESVMTQSGSTIGVSGNIGATGNVGAGTTTPATSLDVFSSTPGIHAPIAQFGSTGTTDSNSILTYNGTGTTEVFQAGCANCFIPLAQPGDGGVRVKAGKNLFLGDSGSPRLRLDSAGNASQPRTANGMVKALLFFSPNNSGRIVSCFNSTLSGTAATTPPCGFGFTIWSTGIYIFDFGFQVDDRFLSVTGTAVYAPTVCVDTTGTLLCNDLGVTNRQVVVASDSLEGGPTDQKVYLAVY